jgi:hypothetical protein
MDFEARIINSVFKISNKDLFKEYVRKLEGKLIKLKITEVNKRSLRQNSYYWAVIIPCWRELIKNEWGEILSNEQTHEFLKSNFNSEEKVIEKTGEILTIPKSTTKNSKTDQEVYHEICRQKALEFFNTIIPQPNEQLNLKL